MKSVRFLYLKDVEVMTLNQVSGRLEDIHPFWWEGAKAGERGTQKVALHRKMARAEHWQINERPRTVDLWVTLLDISITTSGIFFPGGLGSFRALKVRIWVSQVDQGCLCCRVPSNPEISRREPGLRSVRMAEKTARNYAADLPWWTKKKSKTMIFMDTRPVICFHPSGWRTLATKISCIGAVEDWRLGRQTRRDWDCPQLSKTRSHRASHVISKSLRKSSK